MENPMTTRLLAFSDLHGHLCDVATLPAADIAVITGDITPATHDYYGGTASGRYKQSDWMLHTCMPWLETLPVHHVVLTWGNHDHVGEYPDLLPAMVWPERLHMLVNRSVTIDGVSFHGVPQTPRFHDWAFNDDDTEDALGRRWAQIPDGTDVLLSHGPPYGVCDTIRPGAAALGSRTQTTWLQSEASNRPRVLICGHIHGSGGTAGRVGRTDVYNVALVNEQYRVVRSPRVITLDRN